MSRAQVNVLHFSVLGRICIGILKPKGQQKGVDSTLEETSRSESCVLTVDKR